MIPIILSDSPLITIDKRSLEYINEFNNFIDSLIPNDMLDKALFENDWSDLEAYAQVNEMGEEAVQAKVEDYEQDVRKFLASDKVNDIKSTNTIYKYVEIGFQVLGWLAIIGGILGTGVVGVIVGLIYLLIAALVKLARKSKKESAIDKTRDQIRGHINAVDGLIAKAKTDEEKDKLVELKGRLENERDKLNYDSTLNKEED